MKFALYQMETGQAFDRNQLREQLNANVHNLYIRPKPPERWFPYFDNYTTFIIVRDPIKRALSVYTSRVLQHKVLSRPKVIDKVRKLGISAKPDIAEFVDNFEKYQEASSIIRTHTISQAEYAAKIWDRIAHRIPIEEMSRVNQLLNDLTGMEVIIPRELASRKKVSTAELSDRQFNKLVGIFRDDYDMLSDFYSPDMLPR